MWTDSHLPSPIGSVWMNRRLWTATGASWSCRAASFATRPTPPAPGTPAPPLSPSAPPRLRPCSPSRAASQTERRSSPKWGGSLGGSSASPGTRKACTHTRGTDQTPVQGHSQPLPTQEVQIKPQFRDTHSLYPHKRYRSNPSSGTLTASTHTRGTDQTPVQGHSQPLPTQEVQIKPQYRDTHSLYPHKRYWSNPSTGTRAACTHTRGTDQTPVQGTRAACTHTRGKDKTPVQGHSQRLPTQEVQIKPQYRDTSSV